MFLPVLVLAALLSFKVILGGSCFLVAVLFACLFSLDFISELICRLLINFLS